MILTEKERTAIQDLQTQEQCCVEKYARYSKEAKDPVLQSLFQELSEKENEHFQSLGQVLSGSIPTCDCNDDEGKNYQPQATYRELDDSKEKQYDCFLATDCIGTEKMVSTEYNTNVFKFAESDLRKLLADIQIEEQNHAEMLYKYKTVNGMA